MSVPAEPRTELGVTRRTAPPNSSISFTGIGAVNRAGHTEHFELFYERTFGETGRSAGSGVLDRAEPDLEKVSGLFGLSTPADHSKGTPGESGPPAADRFVVVLARLEDDRRTFRETRQTETVFYCDLQATPQAESRQSSFYLAYQLAAVCAERVGWDARIGDALARTIATSLYPRRIIGFATAPVWLDGDREEVCSGPLGHGLSATGGAVLFVNYLHYQLGFSWHEIAASPEPNLGALSRRLIGDGDALGDGSSPSSFRSLMDSSFPVGLPSHLVGDNPYPLDPPALDPPEVDPPPR